MTKCDLCKKEIPENEYIINFGWCDACLDGSFDKYLIGKSFEKSCGLEIYGALG